jgi:hypothetical protein
MAHLKITFSVCFALAMTSIAAGQQFPTTQYQGFGGGFGGGFATSSPNQADPAATESQSSMSPDSWGAPATQVNDLTEFQPQSPAPTPTVPDLNDTNNFQRASVYGSQPIPMPGSSRYPLSGSSDQADSTQSKQSATIGEISSPLNSSTVNSNANDFHSIEGWYDPGTAGTAQSPAPSQGQFQGNFALENGNAFPAKTYRPDLGHRNAMPTQRYGVFDDGKKFDFEDKKKQYPPMSEILATGRYFGSASAVFLKGHFQGNTAIATSDGGLNTSTPYDFDYEVAPQLRFGFESKYGPGIELNYFQYDEASNVASFTSNGASTGTTSAWMSGQSQWSRLQASNVGDRIDTSHAIDFESFGVSFFKEIKFKISRLNGMFGMQYVSVAQSLDATLVDSVGAEIGRLNSSSDFRGFGPRFGMEYYRPVGHTKFEFITTFGGSVLFGQRDQFVQNTTSNDLSRFGADEFMTTIEFTSGLQYKKMIAENRAYYARFGMTYQTWIGGGTAVDPQGDFGLRGFSFAVGYNR